MFKNLKAKLIRLSQEHVPFNPLRFNDPDEIQFIAWSKDIL